MYHYSSPPPGWSAYDYVPSPTPHYTYYAPHYGSPQATPRTKRHAYRSSYSGPKEGPGWHSSPPSYHQHYSWQQSYHHDRVPEYVSTPRKHEHVSAAYGGESPPNVRTWRKQKSRRFSMPNDHPPSHPHNQSYPHYASPFAAHPRSPKIPVFMDDMCDESHSSSDSHEESSPCQARSSRPRFFDHPRMSHRDQFYYSSSRDSRRRSRPTTDQYFMCNQVPPIYNETDSPRRSRARRASTSTRTPQKPRPSPPASSPTKATEEDAIRAGIPSGYSIKNWDPTETPILLLGSVFDANSLGKWIYDWTVFHHGATAPMADVAGDLWLLLIKLAGKINRANECLSLIRGTEAREMVEDFLESGERLWVRFRRLLKACEHFMWKAAKRETGKGSITMGRSSGCEFVDSIFGRDRELENTEKLMNSIRLWDMRFEANCGDILKHPASA